MPGGKKPGPSIHNPATYEALKRAGHSKASAAAISNWAINQGYKKGVHHKGDEDDDEAADGASIEWLMRGANTMLDREFSASRREELAKSGKAMPGGGYPIESRQDLVNAIHAIGRAKNPGAARTHIKKRARAMGLTELIPENWDTAPEFWDARKCPKCDGGGIVNGFKCPRCDGEGYVGIPPTQERDAESETGVLRKRKRNVEGAEGQNEQVEVEELNQSALYERHMRPLDWKRRKKPDDDDDDDMEDAAGQEPGYQFKPSIPGKPFPQRRNKANEQGIEETPDEEAEAEEAYHGPGVMRRRRTRDSRTVHLTDHFVMDGVRKTKDGYLVANARVARAGVQLYNGDELGEPNIGLVRVYRPPEQVFNNKAMHSLAHKPITLSHPPEMIDANNWDKYSIGHTGDEVTRDGDTVRVPMVIMDAKAINAYEKHGFKELSVGYQTELRWGKGITPAGEHYDAIQTAIRGNHLAVVPAARGGSRLRIGDDQTKGVHKMVQVLIGDRLISFEDEAEATHVQGVIGFLEDAARKKRNGKKEEAGPGPAEEEQEEEKKTRGERDAALGQVAVLKKQLEDANARLSGKALDDIVRARTDLMVKADAIMEGRADFSGKEPAEIQRMVVAAKLGDAMARAMTSDEAIAGAFQALAANVKPRTGINRLADNLALLNLGGGNGNDPKAIRDAAYDSYVKRQSEAWRTVGRVQQ